MAVVGDLVKSVSDHVCETIRLTGWSKRWVDRRDRARHRAWSRVIGLSIMAIMAILAI
jgi:hypothetical protein